MTEEVLHTELIEVENILSSEPLEYVSSKITDLEPRSPGCLYFRKILRGYFNKLCSCIYYVPS